MKHIGAYEIATKIQQDKIKKYMKYMKKIEKIDVSRMQPFPDGSIWDCINNANKINELVDAINHLTDSHEEKWKCSGCNSGQNHCEGISHPNCKCDCTNSKKPSLTVGTASPISTPPSWEENVRKRMEGLDVVQTETIISIFKSLLSSEKLKMVEKAQKVLTTSENDVLNFSDETTLRDSYLGGIREVINHLRQELKK